MLTDIDALYDKNPAPADREATARAAANADNYIVSSALVSTSLLHAVMNLSSSKFPSVRPSRSFTLTVAEANSCSPTTRM